MICLFIYDGTLYGVDMLQVRMHGGIIRLPNGTLLEPELGWTDEYPAYPIGLIEAPATKENYAIGVDAHFIDERTVRPGPQRLDGAEMGGIPQVH